MRKAANTDKSSLSCGLKFDLVVGDQRAYGQHLVTSASQSASMEQSRVFNNLSGRVGGEAQTRR